MQVLRHARWIGPTSVAVLLLGSAPADAQSAGRALRTLTCAPTAPTAQAGCQITCSPPLAPAGTVAPPSGFRDVKTVWILEMKDGQALLMIDRVTKRATVTAPAERTRDTLYLAHVAWCTFTGLIDASIEPVPPR